MRFFHPMPAPAKWLLLAGALLRLAAAVHYFNAPLSPAGDDRQYYEISDNLVSHKGYSYHGQPTAYRAPLYPLFQAVIRRALGVSGDPAGRLRIVQAAWSVLSMWLAFQTGFLAGGPVAGIAALGLTAFDVTQMLLPTSLYLESFYSVLLLAVAWAVAAWGLKPDGKRLVCLGLAIALSLMCRSTLVLIPVGILIWRARQIGFCRAFRLEALILVGVVSLPLLPWATRNALVFHRFIPFETGIAGPVLYYASEGRVTAPADEAGDEPMKTMYATLPHTQWDSFASRLALRNILDRPGRYLLSSLERAWALWADSYSCYLIYYHPDHSAFMVEGLHWGRVRLACRVAFALAGLAAFYGVWHRRNSPPVQALAGLALYFNLYALATVFARFNAPLSPIIYILAGVGAASWIERRQPS